MKKTLLLLLLLLATTFSFSQNDCLQADGSFSYEVTLYLQNVPADFDKTSFLNYIDTVDSVSANDLATLTAQITLVQKLFPSQPTISSIKVVATSEIYSILDNLNSTVDVLQCTSTACEIWTDGTFKYHAVLYMENVPEDFDKSDFFSYITNLDNVSSNDLSTLQSKITSVFKLFPTAEISFLNRVISIESNSEIYPNLNNLINSFEYFSCIPESFLGVNSFKENKKSIVFPNPITENSILKLDSDYREVQVEIVNSLGQVIYQQRILDDHELQLKNAPMLKGIYFLEIYDELNGTKEVLKMIK